MFRLVTLILIVMTVGCASHRPATGAPEPDNVVFIVCGVGGATGYDGLVKAVSNANRTVRVISWGAPTPMFFMNFATKSIHDEAEQKLAQRISQWHQTHPAGTIDLIGHSAGGGVVLGALAQLGPETKVSNAILLAPSVSPTYDLRPALSHVEKTLHVFHSDRDTTFLSWRTSNFGTYDRIKTKAAGNTGFVGELPADRVVQHPYDPNWRDLGNDGGHFGTMAREFDEQVIEPLLHQ
jgi:pimeloyl-ACP methyl ester carboxylesterase